jgi:hypothetical protein
MAGGGGLSYVDTLEQKRLENLFGRRSEAHLYLIYI